MSLPLNVWPSRWSVIVSYLGNPLMLTLTMSSLSVVETSISRLTLPPAFTDSVWSSTERTGLVGPEGAGALGGVVAGGSFTVMVCVAGVATAPVTGSFAAAVTASVATG